MLTFSLKLQVHSPCHSLKTRSTDSATLGKQEPKGALPEGTLQRQKKDEWGWMCAEATTLPPKWVQSTDLLGKDNLGKDFIISY